MFQSKSHVSEWRRSRVMTFFSKPEVARVNSATCVSATFRRWILKTLFREDDGGVLRIGVGRLVREISGFCGSNIFHRINEKIHETLFDLLALFVLNTTFR